jgi:hypothetical protein
MLVHAVDFESAAEAVGRFFDETILLHYDSVQCQRSQSYSAAEPHFWPKVEDGIERNRQVLDGFVKEFKYDDACDVRDLKSVSQGYQSKLLHIIVHFLDGFIGIDTVFYNLPEDSHWLTKATRELILANPEQFWLVHVDTAFGDRKIASLV